MCIVLYLFCFIWGTLGILLSQYANTQSSKYEQVSRCVWRVKSEYTMHNQSTLSLSACWNIAILEDKAVSYGAHYYHYCLPCLVAFDGAITCRRRNYGWFTCTHAIYQHSAPIATTILCYLVRATWCWRRGTPLPLSKAIFSFHGSPSLRKRAGWELGCCRDKFDFVPSRMPPGWRMEREGEGGSEEGKYMLSSNARITKPFRLPMLNGTEQIHLENKTKGNAQ